MLVKWGDHESKGGVFLFRFSSLQRKRVVPLEYGSYSVVDDVIFINVFVRVN
jgi:hypothetical protein